MTTAYMSLVGMYNWNNTLFDGMAFPSGFADEDKQLFVNNLLLDSAELEVLYTNWDFLKMAIDNWSQKELITWERIYQASILEYNPIENYNRNEDMTVTHSGDITHSGKDTSQASGNDVDTRAGYDSLVGSGNDTDTTSGYDSVVGSGTDTDTHYKTSYDNNTFAGTEKIDMLKGSTQTNNHNTTLTHTKGSTETTNYNSSITHANGRKDEFTHGHKITDTTSVTTSGNISGNIGVTTSQQMLEQELEVAPKLNIINIMIESFQNRFCLLVY